MSPSSFAWIKQLYITTLQLVLAQWRGGKKATLCPSQCLPYLIDHETFLEGMPVSSDRTYLRNAVVGNMKQ